MNKNFAIILFSAVALVSAGMLLMVFGVFLCNMSLGKSMDLHGVGAIFAAGMMMYGIQSVLAMLVAMWIMNTYFAHVTRRTGILTSGLLCGVFGFMCAAVPFGYIITLSLMGGVAGCISGAIYGVFRHVEADDESADHASR